LAAVPVLGLAGLEAQPAVPEIEVFPLTLEHFLLAPAGQVHDGDEWIRARAAGSVIVASSAPSGWSRQWTLRCSYQERVSSR